jgi:hypothetical protein
MNSMEIHDLNNTRRAFETAILDFISKSSWSNVVGIPQ